MTILVPPQELVTIGHSISNHSTISKSIEAIYPAQEDVQQKEITLTIINNTEHTMLEFAIPMTLMRI